MTPSSHLQNNYVSPLVQFILFAINSLLFFYLVYYHIIGYFPIDSLPMVSPLTPQKIKEYKVTPHIVKAGIEINHFSQFDMIKNNFECSAIVWFKYDPKKISLETLGKFSFEKGTILERSEAFNYVLDDHTSFARYNVKVHVNCDLFYQKFPWDDHRFTLILTHYLVKP